MRRKLGLLNRFRKTRIYTPGMHKPLPKRLNWEQIENQSRQEGRKVVKGTSKRIVVVKSPDPKIFEQAIFIIREDLGAGADHRGDVLKEAQRVADEYIKNSVYSPRRFLSKIPAPLFAAAGAIFTGCIWLIMRLSGF